jgi:hypothetical protein
VKGLQKLAEVSVSACKSLQEVYGLAISGLAACELTKKVSEIAISGQRKNLWVPTSDYWRDVARVLIPYVPLTR